MKDKFKANFLIVLPAAIITIIIFLLITRNSDYQMTEELTYNLFQILPYVLVLVGALIGINVFVVLIGGTVVSLIVGVFMAAVTICSDFGAQKDKV